EPLGIARIQGIPLAGVDGVGREKRCVDEGEQPEPAAVLDLYAIIALTGDPEGLELAGRHPDLGRIHRAEPVGRCATRRAFVRWRGAFVDPATNLAAKHVRISGVNMSSVEAVRAMIAVCTVSWHPPLGTVCA